MLTRSKSHHPWPLRHFPVCIRAGSFPMDAPGCNRTYRHSTVALHLHDYRGAMRIGRRRFELQPGDITLSPGGKTDSSYDLQESGHHLCLHLTAPVIMKSSLAMPLPLHLRLGPAVAEARQRFWRTIDHFRQAASGRNPVAASAASASAQELLLWLHLQGRRTTGPRRPDQLDQSLARFEQAIEASLTKPMLLGELAAHVGLSTDYVARAFAQRYGMRLQRYLLLRRIELARHLLISSDQPVSKIGVQVGLPDPQYFNKQFRRITDISPLAYRQREQKFRTKR